MLLRDTDANQTYFISPDRVSRDMGGVRDADTPVRVQWWDGRPLWVWEQA
jgi:hypothetical protein